MKISHSIIVLTSVIFVTGSMITVGMDLKRTTNNVSTNVIEAKYKHDQKREVYLHDIKKGGEGMDSASNEENERNTERAALKLKSLNQQNNNRPINNRPTNKFL